MGCAGRAVYEGNRADTRWRSGKGRISRARSERRNRGWTAEEIPARLARCRIVLNGIDAAANADMLSGGGGAAGAGDSTPLENLGSQMQPDKIEERVEDEHEDAPQSADGGGSGSANPLFGVGLAVIVTVLCMVLGIGNLPQRVSNLFAYVKVQFASLTASAMTTTTSGSAPIVKSTLGCAGAGLAAGCLHTLAGPDHLAALAPLSIGRSRSVSMVLGALWGGGHTTGQLLVGALIVLFRDTVTKFLPLLSRYGGIAVGLTLVAIGVIGYMEVNAEDGDAEEHGAAAAAASDGDKKANRWFATYATGIVYGFHPDAVMLIVPALALPSTMASAAYILSFCFGTVLAMGAYTGCIGATSSLLSKRVPRINNILSLVSSGIAVALGLALTCAGVFGLDIGI